MKKITIILLLLFSFQNFAQCWKKISAGEKYTVGIADNGTLWAWGLNSSGQLGDGTNVDKWQNPNQSSTETTWTQIATGIQHTLAIKSDGTLWSWGNHSYGKLGLGNIANNINTPTQIGTDTNWASIAAAENHSFAIKTDGTLWAWGSNNSSQLGDKTYTTRYVPIQIGTETNWAEIKTGPNHTLGLKTNGKLYGWGSSNAGQLAGGTAILYSINPLEIEGIYTAISCGINFSVGIRPDGTVWAWGDGSYGQLGQGSITNRYIPTQIGTDTNWKQIAAGPSHLLLLKSDNTLWACGRNHRGQIGNDSTTSIYTPIQINPGTFYIDIFGTGSKGTAYNAGFSLAIKSDGNLQAWGDNEQGQLGDGSRFTYKQIPVDINCPTPFVLSRDSFNKKNFNVYPNPTLDFINLEIEKSTNFKIDIFNLEGKQVGNFNNQKTIDITNLKSGVYFLKTTDLQNHTTSTHKIIKE